ncbi:MAG: DUF58 domain-containing protein [Alphaproteobacteria bacterium]|nr:DUF58 domain-containing protein [Alphaproteobacteria bacterium]
MAKEWPSSVFANKKDLIDLKKKANAFKLKKNKIPVLSGTGEHLSPFKTKGLDFQEVRIYQPGDDIRLIDWRITAKHNKPYTKLFTDEKERQVFLFIDMQQSMKFATQGEFKSVIAAKTGALLSFLGINHHDNLGFTVLSDDKLECAFSGSNSETLTSLLEALEESGNPIYTKESTIPFNQAFLKMEKLIKKGALVFILSDFLHIDDETKKIITRLSKKTTLALLHIYDKIEKEFPHQLLSVTNGEKILFLNGKQKSFQKKYQSLFKKRTEELIELTKNPNIGYLPLSTEEEYLLKVASFCQGGLL